MKIVLYLIAVITSINIYANTSSNPPNYPDDAHFEPPLVKEIKELRCVADSTGYSDILITSNLNECGEHVTEMVRLKQGKVGNTYGYQCKIDMYPEKLFGTTFFACDFMRVCIRCSPDLPGSWETAGHATLIAIKQALQCDQNTVYTEEYDFNGDGKIDRCYNPADKLKNRVKVSDNICWKKGAPTVWTPSTSDEDRIKAAATSALDALNLLDRDMKNPESATDKTKLDAIAQSFSLNGYQDPNFHILASLITAEASCIRQKLEDIITDPQGNNIRINDYEGGFYGVNCKMRVGTEVIDFTELSKKLFTGYTSELSPTISHEVHHRCNARDDLTDNGLGLTTAQIESERADFLNESIGRFKSSISSGDGEAVKKYWARVFITNAYVFEDIMKVYR